MPRVARESTTLGIGLGRGHQESVNWRGLQIAVTTMCFGLGGIRVKILGILIRGLLAVSLYVAAWNRRLPNASSQAGVPVPIPFYSP